ncbi:MAG TPA: MBL fold metallo-hydrolase [Thermoplasmatales archaeon]|nr:MBL fold metallo-hydrolase [Thermoplasmatales archaeon]
MRRWFKPIWFDSLGAKSSCTLIETRDISILLEPGVAIMHKTYPTSEEDKKRYLVEGLNKIMEAGERSKVMVVSHYHHDHYLREPSFYQDKIVFIKNPNEYININQRKRAEEFLNSLYQVTYKPPEEKEYRKPSLPEMEKQRFGEYTERKKELLRKGEQWFITQVERWIRYNRILEYEDTIKIYFPENKTYRFGETTIRFTPPLFHGIEYSRVGWVFATIVEYKDEKLIHTSDLCGPIIEDYTSWIISENPTYLILDGPATYTLGYMLNKINLERAIKNTTRIIRETDVELIIYDHHLTREPFFRRHTKEVWKSASKEKKEVLTAAEYLGETVVVEDSARREI